MKVIDLLNKIANGEEVPKKIKVLGGIYYYCGKEQSGNCYYSEPEGCGGIRLSFNTSQLNDEVEILEEEKEIPEKIECYHQYDECVVKDKFYQDKTGSLVDEIIIDKINEIIDYLKSKGE